MAKRAQVDPDKLNDANIKRVIQLIEAPVEGVKAITKKEACSILGIAYNTTRLDKLLNEYKAKKENERKRRLEKRGKPATKEEAAYVVQEYLKGEPVSDIANAIYRSPSLVKGILDTYSVPVKQASYNYWKPELIPEAAMKDRFPVGSKAYSARYDCMAEIREEFEHPTYGFSYRIWLLGEWQQFAYTPACELASLDHLVEEGVLA